MERQLWPAVYHLVMTAVASIRQVNVTFQPHIIVLVHLWAALHDRPVSWALRGWRRNWAHTTPAPGHPAGPRDPEPPTPELVPSAS